MVYDLVVFLILHKFSMVSSVLSLNNPTASKGSSSVRVLASSIMPDEHNQACLLSDMADVIDLEATSAECLAANL